MVSPGSPQLEAAAQIFRRSLERHRLAHAWLISGGEYATLDRFASGLAKILNCQSPPQISDDGVGLECCERCVSCLQIEQGQPTDVSYVRPEAKSRIITIAQIRAVLESVHLKAYAARHKVVIVSGADRMNLEAANAFLKTLEEPPGDTVLLLLTTNASHLPDTIVSRCLRLHLGGAATKPDSEDHEWLTEFCRLCVESKGDTFGRYFLVEHIQGRLARKKKVIEQTMTDASPLNAYDDLEPDLRKRYQQELAAAIEAEYRRQRLELLALLQTFFRDVWLQKIVPDDSLLQFPDLAGSSRTLVKRLSTDAARGNIEITDELQRHLDTNIQELLAVEVALLKFAL